MAVQQVVAPFASDIISTFDIYKPEKLNKLFRAKGDQGMSYFMLLKSLGFELPVAQDSYSHFEEDFIHSTFTTTTSTAAVPAPGGGVGATQTFVINTTSIGGNNYVYPRKWDTIIFPDNTTASITAAVPGAVTTNVTVIMNTATDALPAVASGSEIVIISNAFAEGSAQPAGRISGTTEYTNFVQIVKESLNATGSEMTNQDWFDELVGDDGTTQQILGYVMKGQINLDYLLNLFASNALLFQKPTTSSNLTDALAANRAIKTTLGLIPDIRQRGNIVNYMSGLYNVSKFDDCNRILDREFCSENVMALLGFDLHTEAENTLVDYFKDTNIKYVADQSFGGDEGLAASVGFKSLKKGDRTFNFKRMGIFSHPKVGGAAGYNFSKMGLFLPLDRRKDAKSGVMIPSIGSRYKSLGKYNRKTEVWNVSGAGEGLKVIGDDLANFYMRMHVGAQHIGVNRFILVEPS